MTRAIVKLWNTEVGALTLDDGEEYASFEYLPSFLKSRIEISPFTMPLSTRVFRFPTLPKETFKGLPGAFSDSLPDRFGNTVINAWLESQGRKADSATLEKEGWEHSSTSQHLQMVWQANPTKSK